jgi:16S rRNA (uracil1498-N3)-methyltransferase
MQRFFVTSPLTIDLALTDESIVHQLTRVMRVKIGDEITLFDGDGSERLYRIDQIAKKSLSLRGRDRTFPLTEAKKSLSLYQALPNKGEKIEFIIQK